MLRMSRLHKYIPFSQTKERKQKKKNSFKILKCDEANIQLK